MTLTPNMIDEYNEMLEKADDMCCKIRSWILRNASSGPYKDYDGHALRIEHLDEDSITILFRRRDAEYDLDNETHSFPLSWFDMNDEEFDAQMRQKFAWHIENARLKAIQKKNDEERTERETLARLQNKYQN